MAAYRYLVLDAQGMDQQGLIEADNPGHAMLLLKARQLYVVRLDAQEAASLVDIRDWLARYIPANSASIALFFRTMGMMLRAGLTLSQALETTASTASSASLRRISSDMAEAISRGKNFSQAMEGFPRVFPVMAVQLVRSAEASGELDSVMVRVAVDLERNIDLKRQFITALTYPGVVFLAAIGVSAFLVLVVIPKFAVFFQKTGRPLPPATQSLMDISNFVVAYGWLIGLLALGLMVGLSVAWSRSDIRPVLDRAVLRIPIIGKIIMAANLAQFSWTSALLLKSGVTLLETLRIAERVVGNAALANAIAATGEGVLRGRSLADGIKRQTVFPPLVAQLAAVGEKTGSLDAVMEELGVHYQGVLAGLIKTLSAFIEPIMILLIGAMVGFVYYAFFSALFSVAG